MAFGCKRAGGLVDTGCLAPCDCDVTMRMETPAADRTPHEEIERLSQLAQTERASRKVAEAQREALQKSYQRAMSSRLAWRQRAEEWELALVTARAERDALALAVLTLTNERDEARARGV